MTPLTDKRRHREFASLGDTAYFDTPTQGVASSRSVAALHEAVRLWESGKADWRTWEEDAQAARVAVASILNCSPFDVALIPSVVSAAATLAVQLPPGCIVVADCEYRSNLLPWLAQRRFGREVDIVEGNNLSEQLMERIDSNTALVAVSSVQSADGNRINLNDIVARAHDEEALVFIDATQSLGVVEFDVTSIPADFVAAAGYKWLLGGRGTGYLYVRPELQRTLRPVLASPMSAADVLDGLYYGEPYTPFDDARRFEQSLAWFSWVTARPAVELLAHVGVSELERHALSLASRFRRGCAGLGYEEGLSTTELSSPIVSLAVPKPQKLQQELKRHRIIATIRSTGVRLGFHLYNDESHVDRALEVISDHLSATHAAEATTRGQLKEKQSRTCSGVVRGGYCGEKYK